jgi:N-formylglutamate amidohydrolase
VHALQVEINRALYLDEASFTKNRGFPKLSRTLGEMSKRVFDALPMLLEGRAAAE